MLDVLRRHLRVTEKTGSQRIKDRLDEVFHVQRPVTVVSRVKTEGKGNSELYLGFQGSSSRCDLTSDATCTFHFC